MSPLVVQYNHAEILREESITKGKILFADFVTRYINRNNRPDHYRRSYTNLLSHISNYCEKYDISPLYTNSIDLEFCEGFIDYLRSDAMMMQNTIKGQMEKLGAMLHKAVLFGYPINNTFREVKVPEEEASAVYFDTMEIARLYYFKGLTRFQQEVRDLFIVGCYTGLRYSDYSVLNQSHFINHGTQIRIKTKKTGAVVQLPVQKFITEIMEKYGGQMPRAHCIQYFDRAIKHICQKVGFNEPVLFERTVGNEVVRKTLQKWEVISSHTARRSFATNAFLANIPPFRIMLITGHRSEKSFFRYIRITREENALSLSNHRFFQ